MYVQCIHVRTCTIHVRTMYVQCACISIIMYVHVPTQLLPATAFENCPDILKVDMLSGIGHFIHNFCPDIVR